MRPGVTSEGATTYRRYIGDDLFHDGETGDDEDEDDENDNEFEADFEQYILV